jgi:hypothetical protein
MLTAAPDYNPSLYHDEKELWFAWPIRHVVLEERGVTSFNEAVARHAHMEIYGARRDEVESVHAAMGIEPLDELSFEPIWIAMNGAARMDVTYSRLRHLISIPPVCLPAVSAPS